MPRRTTQAVRVGTAKGKSKAGPRKAVGYAGRTATGGRGGLSDAALQANNRGSGGKAAPGTGMGGSAGGVPTGGGRAVVEETRSSGGTPVAVRPRTPLPRVNRGFEGEQVALATATTRAAAPAPTRTVTKRVMPAKAKPPVVKKPVAKKKAPEPAAARHKQRLAAKKPTSPSAARHRQRLAAKKKKPTTRTIGYTAPASARK